MWFDALMGFTEDSPEQVRSMITVDGDHLVSKANGRRVGCGRLETPSLAELRARATPSAKRGGSLREVVADVQKLHTDPANAGAVFQVASQFNLLEMVGPRVTPEQGVSIYAYDRTQGPACAIACGAGTIWRNYFVPLGDQRGQTGTRQIDCLAELGDALGNGDASLWRMQNGYALPVDGALAEIDARLAALDDAALDALRGRLRIGVHHDVEVTLGDAGHRVTQIYGSALPVAYGRGHPDAWARWARLVLEASYEATLHAAVESARASGNPTVYLTLLGGGAFGNQRDWIFDAIERAVRCVPSGELDLAIVSYGRSNPAVRAFVDRL